MSRLLVIDIETAPHKVYAWGLWDQRIATNQIVEPGYTLCFAAKWLDEREIMFHSVREGARKMLRKAHALLDEADAVIHYNGRSFDVPTLRGEFMAAHFRPAAPFAQIDLINVARSARMASRKLDYLAQSLGLGHKVETKGMELWRGCMDGDAKAWARMERYNKQDVRLTERIYRELRPWIKAHPNLSGGEIACPHCQSEKVQARGYDKTRTMRYRRYQCQECGTWFRDVRAASRHAQVVEIAA